jgi:hypothetical protein
VIQWQERTNSLIPNEQTINCIRSVAIG